MEVNALEHSAKDTSLTYNVCKKTTESYTWGLEKGKELVWHQKKRKIIQKEERLL